MSRADPFNSLCMHRLIYHRGWEHEEQNTRHVRCVTSKNSSTVKCLWIRYYMFLLGFGCLFADCIAWYILWLHSVVLLNCIASFSNVFFFSQLNMQGHIQSFRDTPPHTLPYSRTKQHDKQQPQKIQQSWVNIEILNSQCREGSLSFFFFCWILASTKY